MRHRHVHALHHREAGLDGTQTLFNVILVVDGPAHEVHAGKVILKEREDEDRDRADILRIAQ